MHPSSWSKRLFLILKHDAYDLRAYEKQGKGGGKSHYIARTCLFLFMQLWKKKHSVLLNHTNPEPQGLNTLSCISLAFPPLFLGSTDQKSHGIAHHKPKSAY